MSKVCAFWGHREIPAGLDTPLEEQIRKAIIEDSITSFWVGGYGQFDSLAAHTVHKLKQEFPEIELLLILAYLPGKGQPIPEIYDGTMIRMGWNWYRSDLLFPSEMHGWPRTAIW